MTQTTMYAEVDPDTGELGARFFGTPSGCKVGGWLLPLRNLAELNVYPVREPVYNLKTQVAGPLHYDPETRTVTRRVYEFSKGLAHSWKVREFNPDGGPFRPFRARVRWLDTLSGGPLSTDALNMLISGVPRFRTDATGALAEATGEYLEVYFNYVRPDDAAKLQQYCALAGGGCVFENYAEL